MTKPKDVTDAETERRHAMMATHGLVTECKPIFDIMSTHIAKIGKIHDYQENSRFGRVVRHYSGVLGEFTQALGALITESPFRMVKHLVVGTIDLIKKNRRNKATNFEDVTNKNCLITKFESAVIKLKNMLRSNKKSVEDIRLRQYTTKARMVLNYLKDLNPMLVKFKWEVSGYCQLEARLQVRRESEDKFEDLEWSETIALPADVKEADIRENLNNKGVKIYTTHNLVFRLSESKSEIVQVVLDWDAALRKQMAGPLVCYKTNVNVAWKEEVGWNLKEHDTRLTELEKSFKKLLELKQKGIDGKLAASGLLSKFKITNRSKGGSKTPIQENNPILDDAVDEVWGKIDTLFDYDACDSLDDPIHGTVAELFSSINDNAVYDGDEDGKDTDVNTKDIDHEDFWSDFDETCALQVGDKKWKELMAKCFESCKSRPTRKNPTTDGQSPEDNAGYLAKQLNSMRERISRRRLLTADADQMSPSPLDADLNPTDLALRNKRRGLMDRLERAENQFN